MGHTPSWTNCHVIPCFDMDNRTEEWKSPFESAKRFAIPIQHEFIAQRFEEPIHVKGYIFTNLHLSYIFRIEISNRMPMCIIERAIRATSKFNPHVCIAMQMIYGTLKDVWSFFCFTSETISTIKCDTAAFRSLGPRKVGAHKDHPTNQRNNNEEFSENVNDVVASVRQQLMKNNHLLRDYDYTHPLDTKLIHWLPLAVFIVRYTLELY
jgi:hypothetical protein